MYSSWCSFVGKLICFSLENHKLKACLYNVPWKGTGYIGSGSSASNQLFRNRHWAIYTFIKKKRIFRDISIHVARSKIWPGIRTRSLLNCRCNGFRSASGFLSTWIFSVASNGRKNEDVGGGAKKKVVSNNITVSFYGTTKVHGKHFSLSVFFVVKIHLIVKLLLPVYPGDIVIIATGFVL